MGRQTSGVFSGPATDIIIGKVVSLNFVVQSANAKWGFRSVN